jgi:hypothetical protein
MNQIMLQVPGVVQETMASCTPVVNDAAAISHQRHRHPGESPGSGNSSDSRFAERIEFLTGALPAEYNYRTRRHRYPDQATVR